MFARRWESSNQDKASEKKKIFNNNAALNNIDQLSIQFFLDYADALLTGKTEGYGISLFREDFNGLCNEAAIHLRWAVNQNNVNRYSFHIDEFISKYLLCQKWRNSNEPNYNTSNWQNVVRNHLTNVVKKNVNSDASLRILIKMYIFELIYGDDSIRNEKLALACKA